jgi:hypothetical protein
MPGWGDDINLVRYLKVVLSYILEQRAKVRLDSISYVHIDYLMHMYAEPGGTGGACWACSDDE